MVALPGDPPPRPADLSGYLLTIALSWLAAEVSPRPSSRWTGRSPARQPLSLGLRVQLGPIEIKQSVVSMYVREALTQVAASNRSYNRLVF